MTEKPRSMLLAILETGYFTLREKLRRRLGSADLADDALQETWLRLERSGDLGAIQSPNSYLFRVALNVAADRREAEKRRLNQEEILAMLHMADDALDPSRIAEAHAEFEELGRALDALSPRRRAIFMMARVDEVAHDEIARRFGISARMVEKELRYALDHCAARLDRKVVRRFGPRSRKSS